MDLMQVMQARGFLAFGVPAETVETADPLPGFEEVLDQIEAEVSVDGLVSALILVPAVPAQAEGATSEPITVEAVENAVPLPAKLAGLANGGAWVPEQLIGTEISIIAPLPKAALPAAEGQAVAMSSGPQNTPSSDAASPSLAGIDPPDFAQIPQRPHERQNTIRAIDRAEPKQAENAPEGPLQVATGVVLVSVPARNTAHLQSRQAAAALRIAASSDVGAGAAPEPAGVVQIEVTPAFAASVSTQPVQPAPTLSTEIFVDDMADQRETTEVALADPDPSLSAFLPRDAPLAQHVSASAPDPALRGASPEQVTRQVARVIVHHAEDRAEVLLEPAELGRLQFEIRPRGDGVQILVMAERPETMDLLRRHADLLLRDLQSEGFTGSELGFGSWDGQGQTPQGLARFDAIAQTETLSDPPLPTFTAAPAPRNSAGGLDLRL